MAELLDAESIGVWAPGPVGDLVMATPAFSALAAAFPQARRVAYASEACRALLQGNGWFHEVKARSKQSGAMSSLLRAERHDLLILLTNSFRSAWIAWRGRARARLGYASAGRRWLLTRAVPRRRGRHAQDPAPMVELYLELLSAAGIPAPQTAPTTLAVTAEEEREADRILAGWSAGQDPGALVAISPGAAYGPAKRWPIDRFAAVASSLIADAEVRARVVLLFAPDEGALIAELLAAAGSAAANIFAQQIPLGPTKAILARAQLHITNDTGSRHIGHALGVPTLSILGPTQAAWSSYPGQRGEVMQLSVPCGPCMKRVCPIGTHICMKDQSVERILEAARRVLA